MKAFVFAAALACALAAVSGAGAARPQTFDLLEINTGFAGAAGYDTMGTTPPKIGQGFVITSDYYRWNGVKRGARVGTLKAVCLFVTQPTSDSGTSLCTGVATLPAGTITVVGLVRGAKFRVPIVGGTGAYTGAKGYLAITNNLGGPNTNKSNDKFVITG